MPVVLEGGCRVVGLKEGEPVQRGVARAWEHFRPGIETTAVSLSVLEIEGDVELSGDSEEVLYVVQGKGNVIVGGLRYDIREDSGIHRLSRQSLTLQCSSAMTLVSVTVGLPLTPDPSPREERGERGRDSAVVHLRDREAKTTGDRWYCELIESDVTQFVGAIPPGRAPDHYHDYEEVLCILAGEGAMWAGASSTPIAAGSCIFLPRGQVHCVENFGREELRLLGVFYPAGSPAVRYSASERAR